MSELWSHPLLLVVLSLLLIGGLVTLPRRVATAPSWALFGSVLPSWRLFDQVELVPTLQYRVAPHGADWSDWQDALTVPARTPSSFWLNAAGNFHLACQSLIEHLVADLDAATELGQSQELVSYQLVRALIEQRVRMGPASSAAQRYQFRLMQSDPEQSTLFLSRVHAGAVHAGA